LEEIDTVMPQPKSPGKSATGISSTTVMPARANSGSSSLAAPQVPAVVKVPMCIS
jgi:hypothetical protein